MVDVFYKFNFESNFGFYGCNVALFKNGKVFGGGDGMTYTGEYKIDGKNIVATLSIHDQKIHTNSIPLIENGNLNLRVTGKIASPKILFTGHVIEDKNCTIKITAKRYSAF